MTTIFIYSSGGEGESEAESLGQWISIHVTKKKPFGTLGGALVDKLERLDSSYVHSILLI